jgi:hypothetical protein
LAALCRIILTGQRLKMADIDGRLGFGKSEPHQRIEQVMPVVLARRHFTFQVAARFVLCLEGQPSVLLRHQSQR